MRKEARDVFEGARLGVENGWNAVEIDSDDASVINNLRGIDKSWRIEIQNSLILASHISNITWRCIPRTANQSADWVVNQVINNLRRIDKSWRIKTIIQKSLILVDHISNTTWRCIPKIANQSANWVEKQALAGMNHSE